MADFSKIEPHIEVVSLKQKIFKWIKDKLNGRFGVSLSKKDKYKLQSHPTHGPRNTPHDFAYV